MDRAVLLIYLIVGLSIVGLVVTADNEPTPTVIPDKEDRPHLVDRLTGTDPENIKVIRNPETILR